SALLLGTVEFFNTVPTLFFTPFAGVVADRWNRHRMVILIQTLAMIQAFILAFLVLFDVIQVWHIFALSLFFGVIHSFDIPIRQAFVMDMLEKKEDIGNAIALNSSLFNTARIIGPSIAGVTIAIVGEGWCFFINAVSFLAVIFALFAMRLQAVIRDHPKHHVFREIADGFNYTFRSYPIRSVLLLLSLISLVGLPYHVLMPVMAKDVLLGDSRTLGFLMASIGLGALTGAYYLASRRDMRAPERRIAMASYIFSIALIVFSLSRNINFSMIVLIFCGFGLMVQMASCNTLLQTITDENKRGRVLSYYTLSFQGASTIGGLMAGAIAEKITAPSTLLIGGSCSLIGVIFFTRKLPILHKKIYRIYRKKGLIPPRRDSIDPLTK
ncbi:MFS transporter, partial [Candidatus Sumerlaeota bacterium]|nr:MFS transporter [Candidatus Sumerlaeota bacterium]